MKQAPTCLPSTNLDFDEAPTSRASTLSSQGTNLVFRGTYPKHTNPSIFLIEIVLCTYLTVINKILHCTLSIM